MSSSSVCFPYAIGALASYAWSFKDISDFYELKKVFFLSQKLSEVIDCLEQPFLVVFFKLYLEF